MKSEIEFTSEDVVEYLKITYALLQDAKSSLDLEKLNAMINYFKNNKNSICSKQSNKTNYKVDSVIELLDKARNENNLSNEDKILYKTYQDNMPFLGFVEAKDTESLLSYLQRYGKDLSVNELTILYYSLLGEKNKSKKKEEILQTVISHVNQKFYFDNMDARYSNDKSISN